MPRLRTVAVKPWWKSRIIWVNTLTILITILMGIAERADLLPENAALVVTTVAAILTIILRAITTAPLSTKTP